MKADIHLISIMDNGIVEYSIKGIRYTYTIPIPLKDIVIKLNSRSPGRAFNQVKKYGRLVSKHTIE